MQRPRTLVPMKAYWEELHFALERELVAELRTRRCHIFYDDGDRSIDEGLPETWGWAREPLS